MAYRPLQLKIYLLFDSKYNRYVTLSDNKTPRVFSTPLTARSTRSQLYGKLMTSEELTSRVKIHEFDVDVNYREL